MVTAKLNALHLHLVDSQAFPLVLPSAPRLSQGAYSSEEQYEIPQRNNSLPSSWLYVVEALDPCIVVAGTL